MISDCKTGTISCRLVDWQRTHSR